MANGTKQAPWVDSGDGQKPPKRISTPAGNRLSAIMNDSSGRSRWSRNDGNKSTMTAPVIPPIEDLAREDSDDPADHDTEGPRHSTAPIAYVPDTHSEKSMFAAQQQTSQTEKPQRRLFGSWSRKKLFIVLGIVALALIGLIVGLAVGLTQNSKSSSDDTASSPAGSGSATATSGSSIPTGLNTLAAPTNVPKDFPVGRYSMYTFLDTIYSNCSSDPAAWTCVPGTIYNDDRTKAASTFHFNITGASGSYQIQPFGSDGVMKEWKFATTPLQIENVGKNDERYRFQVIADKAVITKVNGTDAICEFPATTFSGKLYTKLVKTYPSTSDSQPATSDSTWPFQMTFETNNGGGEGVSKCVDIRNGALIGAVTGQAFGDTCSCFYRNWTPSIPT